MRILYLHASKFGNGEIMAAEFERQMATKGVDVDVHHIREMKPSELPSADLYLFSSPGRFGRPIRGMRRFLNKVMLPPGTRYAVLTTEAMPKPDQKTGQMPTEEQLVANQQRVRPIMNEILEGKGLVRVAEEKVHVTGLRGPLEDGWETTVDAFASALQTSLGRGATAPARAPREAA